MKLKGNFELESDNDITDLHAIVKINYFNGKSETINLSSINPQRRPASKSSSTSKVKKDDPDPDMVKEF